MLSRFDFEPRRGPPEHVQGSGSCRRCLLVVLVGFLGLIAGEFASVAWTIRRCRLPVVRSADTPLFLAVSDVHILGTKKTSLDIWWTTVQLRKILWLAVKIVNPDALFILGDHFDQGGYASPEEWETYLQRYLWAIKPLRNRVNVLDSVIGNHDAQFIHLGMTNEMLERFKRDFGEVNGVTSFGNVEVVWVNALAIFDPSRSSSHLETMQFLEDIGKRRKDSGMYRILLSHVPPFRVNDLDCGKSRLRESGHVTYVGPDVALKVNEDVLDPASSKLLLTSVKPDVMLSGHLHSHCYRQNTYELSLSDKSNVTFLDLSVPTLAYRMRPDPGFTLVTFAEGRAYGKTCKIPSERTIIAFEVISLLLILTGTSGCVLAWRQSARNYIKVE